MRTKLLSKLRRHTADAVFLGIVGSMTSPVLMSGVQQLRALVPDPPGTTYVSSANEPPTANRFVPVTYASRPGDTLYVRGASASDPKQSGYLGDCGIVAALSTYAHRIEQNLKPTADGRVEFTGFSPQRARVVTIASDGSLESSVAATAGAPLAFSMSTAIPRNATLFSFLPDGEHARQLNKRATYAWSKDDGELWVPLAEKAFATLAPRMGRPSGYAGLWSSDPAKVMSALTGKTTDLVHVESTTQDALWSAITRAKTDGRGMVAATKAGLVGGTEAFLRGLAVNHAYSVLDAKVEDGERYVIVRNAWGVRGAFYVPVGNATFAVKLSTFASGFDRLWVN